MRDDERTSLIDDLLDGSLSEAEFLRLEAELSIDPAARKEYYARLCLTAALESEAQAASLETKVTPFVGGHRVRWGLLAGGAAAAVVAVFMVVSSRAPSDAPNQVAEQLEPVEQRASGFAVLSGQVDARWRGGYSPVDGALLPGGKLNLEEGVAQLELFSGVMVVVEAPAEFEVISSMEMAVSKGRLRAHVPEPAHGFKIHTIDGEIVDLGTEFAVNVSDDHSEVHVLEGEIEWHARVPSAPRKMTEREAVWTTTSTGEDTGFSADAAAFLGASELRERMVSSRSNRQAVWETFSHRLKDDPRLVAYFRTGNKAGWSRRVPNLARHGAAREGAIVAAVGATDRWAQSDGALDFSPTGSRIRVTIPGSYQSVSLVAWVKINSLDRWYNSLFLTDGHELHEPHWQIMDDGRLFFSVKKRDQWDAAKGERDKHIFYSPSFWEPSLSGQWMMIATVYDIDAREVTHFLNGKPLSTEAIPDEYVVETVKIGNASLGNWSLPENDDPHFAVRNLNGSMDAFMLFSVALTPQEILQFYELGKP
ncbi:MAG: hypothetical protein ACI9R3_003929 [Verrucomicrobiales bacterium]|jgi:hypothetical protein